MKNYIILVLSIFMILFLCGNVTAAQIPDNNDINLTVSNDNGARFNYNNDNTYSFFKGTGTGGTNALKINDDNGTTAKVISTSAQSGTFYIVNTGGKGYSDNAILMLAVNGTIPDDFQLHITASGYQWTPLLTGKPLYDNVTYNSVTIDETFTKSDFIYGPQIWKPYYQSDYPIYEKQDMSNTSNRFYIMFIDLYSGILKQSDYSQSLMNSGALKIQYSFQNLPAGSLAAFNTYTYALAPETGQTTGGIAWTNKVNTASQTAIDSTGYYVSGVNSNAPTADFTATPTSGTSPLNVQFNDQSTGNPSSYAWDFDNNGITDSTAQNPTYIYNSPGTYTVKLTVTGTGGSNEIVKTNYITANKAPITTSGTTKIISTTPSGRSTDSNSDAAKVSADGRYVVYESTATNIVSGDNNGVSDIFLYDRVTKTTIRVNRGPANAQAIVGGSYNPSISADGRYIVYESDATNLVSGDTNGVRDIFLYDRMLNKTIRANRGVANAQTTGGNSTNPAISSDGRYIIYQSLATNLVNGDKNGNSDIFLYDRIKNTTIRANRGNANAQATGGDSTNADISGDGRYIVYESKATNLVSGDTNGVSDIFLYDRVTNKTIRANRGSNNAQATGGDSTNPSINANGRYIVYDSTATNLVSGDTNGLKDVFLYDRIANKTIRANRGAANAQATGGNSGNPSISSDGRYIVYDSTATNLVSGDTNGLKDIFLYDITLNKTIRANRGPNNAQLTGGGSFNPSISSYGKYIVYESDTNDITPNDNNAKRDIFLYPV